MQIEMQPLGQIQPYPQNPRANDAAVDADAASIPEVELWRPVPGYEELYDVSTEGRVRRASTSRITPAGYILNPRTSWDGYLQLGLYRRSRYQHFKVHRLVALAFLGPPPFRPAHVAHGDGNQRNNRLSNLRWATPTENEADKRRHGRVRGAAPGEDHPGAKLTVALVQQMRRAVAAGAHFRRVADCTGVPARTAYEAIYGRTWRCVTEPPPLTPPRRRRQPDRPQSPVNPTAENETCT